MTFPSDSFQTIPVSCNKDCGGGCPLVAEISNGRVVRIRDNPDRPHYMQGCLKGYRMADVLYHPDRILHPLVRCGKRGSASFRKASWSEALDLIAEKLTEVKAKKGVHSIIRLGGSGSCRGALHHTARLTSRFLSLFGGYTDTAGNYSSEASDFVKPFMYGTDRVGIDVESLEDARAIVLWGFNPFYTRFGSETQQFLLALSKRGIPFIVIDPRRTASVRKLGAKWFPIRPGSDGVLLSALIHHLACGDARDRFDRSLLERYTVGFDRLEAHLSGAVDGVVRDIEWAAPLCGLSTDDIRFLADFFADTKPLALLSGLSVQRTLGGEEADRLAGVLQLVSGNAWLPGGNLGCGQWNMLPKPRCGKISVPQTGNVVSVPVYLWPDAILEGRAGGFPSSPSFIYCVGGNYLGQGSDLNKSRRAFDKAEFSVVHDYFLTETASWADIVLPATTFLEREDICFVPGNYLFYSAQAVPPQGEAKNDYEIFSLLAERLGFAEEFTAGLSEAQWIEKFLDESVVDDQKAFRDCGIWFGKEHRRRALADFFADPEGKKLSTPSGKIEIVSQAYEAAGGPLWPVAHIPEPPDGYPLMLITPHERYRTHSQFDNLPVFRRLCFDKMMMHPEDALSRGIGEGDKVVVKSEVGSMVMQVAISNDIARGVVSANQGTWPRVDAESGLPAGNVNVLTSTEPTLPSRGSRTHSVFVEVSPWLPD